MCGIVGIFDPRGPIDVLRLDRFTDSLAHRGPDGRGTYIEGNVGLGHRRLAILDLSDAGRCPMNYGGADGKRYWITYNGEVYNFIEIRNELEGKGHRFKTNTDTEVILAAYAEWGEDCQLRFNGMWAFAIWDSVEKRLFLSRDRYGIKPLYIHIGDVFAFSSELKAFIKLAGFKPEFNADVLPAIIKNAQSYEGMSDQTLMRGIQRLMPGQSLTVTNKFEFRVTRWWDALKHVKSPPASYADQIEGFRELFNDAVRIRMRSDVPIGTCLSGGLDSSSVACTMAEIRKSSTADLSRCNPDWQRTVVATFPGSKIDERAYADQVIKKLGIKPTYWVFEDKVAQSHLLDSVWAMEDVYLGICTPIWCTYREMRRAGVVVSLDGHGADEMLGGYPYYLDVPMSRLKISLLRDSHFTLLPSILRNFDRCSMAHGIEVRMPFMDWRLVSYCAALPADSLIGGGYTKRVLRDSMIGILPEPIRKRRYKIGFNAPMIEWFNGGMRPLIYQTLDHPLWMENGIADAVNIRKAVKEKCASASWTSGDWDAALTVWMLMNIVLWRLMFIEGNTEQIRATL
jgi:asparagine synthase (glutamine-hydrolysing)